MSSRRRSSIVPLSDWMLHWSEEEWRQHERPQAKRAQIMAKRGRGIMPRGGGMSEIVLEQVTKRYGRVTAVEDVSFRAERASFVVLLGPSGCGKSTLLRLIAGLEELT